MAKLNLIKEVKNGALYEDAEGQPYIRIEDVRASYPFLGTPSNDENENGVKTKKWRIVLMLPKKTHTEIKDLIVSIINRLMKSNAPVPKDRWFIKNGDDSEDEAMHGHWLVSCSDGKYRPKVRDEHNVPMLEIDEIDSKFYGGCWVHGLIRPWFFTGKSKSSKKTFPKRLCAGITSVVFVDDDKPFGAGRVDDGDVWGDEDDGAGMDDTPRRSRSSRNDDDDDDDRGSRGRSSRSSRDDDDDDDRSSRGRSGSRGRSRDDDDDDDDRGSRGRSSGRGRSRDDDDDDAAAGL